MDDSLLMCVYNIKDLVSLLGLVHVSCPVQNKVKYKAACERCKGEGEETVLFVFFELSPIKRYYDV